MVVDNNNSDFYSDPKKDPFLNCRQKETIFLSNPLFLTNRNLMSGVHMTNR